VNKFILFLAVLIGLSVLVWYHYFYDNVVTSGSKYGFDIGMTTDEALVAIDRNYSDDDIQVVLSPRIEMSTSNEIVYLDIKQLNKDKVEGINVWQLRFEKSETNVLVLHFSDGNLVEMTRYRRAFIP
jgi:hypothetical protein